MPWADRDAVGRRWLDAAAAVDRDLLTWIVGMLDEAADSALSRPTAARGLPAAASS